MMKEDGSFYYTSNEGKSSAPRRSTRLIRKEKKKDKVVSTDRNKHTVFSKSMKYYMNKYSSLDTPMQITLNDNTGKTLKTLVTNDQLKQKLAGYAVPRKNFSLFRLQMGDIERLDDETCQFFRFEKISGTDVPIQRPGLTTGAGYMGESVGKRIWQASATSLSVWTDVEPEDVEKLSRNVLT